MTTRQGNSVFKRAIGLGVGVFGGVLIWKAGAAWAQALFGGGIFALGLYIAIPDEMAIASGYLVSLLRNLGLVKPKPPRRSGETQHGLTISDPVRIPDVPGLPGSAKRKTPKHSHSRIDE